MSLETIDPDILAEVRAALDADLADWDQLIANGDFSNRAPLGEISEHAQAEGLNELAAVLFKAQQERAAQA